MIRIKETDTPDILRKTLLYKVGFELECCFLIDFSVTYEISLYKLQYIVASNISFFNKSVKENDG